MNLTGSQVGLLLNAYRATVNGTVSSRSPLVPSNLGGYLVAPSRNRRPLGETRYLLRKALVQCRTLTMTERSIVSLYYGLDLTILPMNSTTGPSLATLLGPAASTTGRPRITDSASSVARSIRYIRQKALNKLAEELQPLASVEPVKAIREPEPTESEWLRQDVQNWSETHLSALQIAALRSARLQAGLHPEVRQEIWLDLDWWAYQNELLPVAAHPIGRPSTRINSERMARATARISIAMWDELQKSRQKRKTTTPLARNTLGESSNGQGSTDISPSHKLILIPPSELGQLLLLNDPIEIAHEAISRLAQTEGLSDQSTAIILNWLEPVLRRSSDDGLYARAAAAISLAAAQHSELNSIALQWFEKSIDMKVVPRYMAETALNLSVVYSERRRYREADLILRRAAEKTHENQEAQAAIALGGSAWRRRLISEAIDNARVGTIVPILPVARECIQIANNAVHMLGTTAGPTSTLRTEVRLAEALSVGTVLSDRMTVSSVASSNSFRDEARRSVERILQRVTHVAKHHPLTSFTNTARIEVITDVSRSLDDRCPMSQFYIRERVKRMQQIHDG